MLIQQSLHGYSDGHRRLAGSEGGGQRDSRLVLALSDIAGPGLRVPSSGYLTGYPLRDAPYYVVARTWAAPEMPRPGCVWTHSLYIQFSDLAEVEAFDLLHLFRRPDQSDLRAYQSAIPYRRLGGPVLPAPTSWLRSVVWSLYARPDAKLIARARDDENVETEVLSVWQQQWTELRRGFRFCTATTTDRSSTESRFDIQVIPNVERGSRLKFGNAIEVVDDAPDGVEWLDLALDDLASNREAGLKRYFESIGNVDGLGRVAFAPMCELFVLMKRVPEDPGALAEALRLVVARDSPLSASYAATLELGHAIARCSDEVLLRAIPFMLSDLLRVASTVSGLLERIASLLWVRDPITFFALAKKEEFLDFCAAVVANQPVESVIHALLAFPTDATFIIAAKPEIVENPGVWRSGVASALRAAIAHDKKVAARGLKAAILYDGGASAEDFVRTLGASAILDQLAGTMPSMEGPTLSQWLVACGKDLSGVADYLTKSSDIDAAVVVSLAKAFGPDSLPQRRKRDAWEVAGRRLLPTLSEDYFRAFLFARALGASTDSQVELCEETFEHLHETASRASLSDEAWSLLEPRLPTSEYWFDWDHCMRLRAALVDLFVSRELSPASFSDVITDDQLFGALSVHAMYDPRGRAYVAKVRRALRDTAKHANRLRLLDRLLG